MDRPETALSKKRKPLGASFIGTLSDLTFCMGRQWRKPLPACSFSVLILSVLRLRHLRLRCHLLHDHFQRGNEVDFGTLRVFC